MLAAVPTAAATWFASGTYEPDTTYDDQGGWMQQGPDVSPDQTVREVYFNAYSTEYAASTNPNLGAAGSRVQSAPTLYFHAYLGVWKDCNGDGYVGLAESAAREYRAELVDVTSVCPVVEDDPLAHNDGEWVFEYLPIGYNSTADYSRSFFLAGSSAAAGGDFGVWIWGDRGAPGAAPGTSCPIVPLPHGTSANTGLAIRYADCFIGQRIATTVNTVDGDGSLGLAFDDANNPQNGDSLLNQDLPESLFGNPHSGETGTLQKDPENEGESAFTTWDCRARAAEVRDPTAEEGKRGSLSNWTVRDPSDGNLSAVFGSDGEMNVTLADETGAYAWIATPAFNLADPTWSVAAGLNHTAEGARVEAIEGTGDCDTSNGNDYNGIHNTAFFYPDGQHSSTAQAPGKMQNEFGFGFTDGAEESIDPSLGARAPGTLGVNSLDFVSGVGWRSGTAYVATPQSVNRNTLSPDPALYWTFYARVDPAVVQQYGLSMPNGAAMGTYGSENCASIAPGAPNEKGWVCDPEKWYVDPTTGEDVKPPAAQRVGAGFNLRDVDCFDGTVARGSGAYASLAWVTEEGVCADASS